MVKKNEMVPLTKEQLEVLNNSFPIGEESSRLSLPKMGMVSKDIVEEVWVTDGKKKKKELKIVQSAGTFYTERDEGEVNEEGKKIWTRRYLDGETVEVIITYYRHQLRLYDSSLNKFISTPVYDSPTQILPLYLDKQIIKRGTEKELQALYPKLTQKGKPSSKLDKKTILYVLFEGELYQFDLSVSSGWEFSTYKRKVNPATVVTTLGSRTETFGTNTYNKVTFKSARPVTGADFEAITESQTMLREHAEQDASRMLSASSTTDSVDEEAVKNF